MTSWTNNEEWIQQRNIATTQSMYWFGKNLPRLVKSKKVRRSWRWKTCCLSLPLIRKVCKLNECVVTETTVNNERCFLTCLYRSPNQNQEQFESFCKNLIDVLSGINNQQPTCSILVGDFNAKWSKWYSSDKDRKAGQGINTFTTTSGYTQMIGQPTHIMNDQSSCIDVFFATNSKLLCDVGVEQTTCNKCHHNIIYGSLNLNIPISPPCYMEVWDYKNTDPVCIQCSVLLVNWNYVFSNKTPDEKVKSLNIILLNIFRNFIPNKIIKFDYK